MYLIYQLFLVVRTAACDILVVFFFFFPTSAKCPFVYLSCEHLWSLLLHHRHIVNIDRVRIFAFCGLDFSLSLTSVHSVDQPLSAGVSIILHPKTEI